MPTTTKKSAPPKKKKAAREFCPHCGQPIRRELTDHQRQIVRMVALGMTSSEIGDELEISRRTVEFHRKVISERLGVKSVAGLTIWASKNGLL